MSNRNLNPMRSTLPGPAGKRTNKLLSKDWAATKMAAKNPAPRPYAIPLNGLQIRKEVLDAAYGGWSEPRLLTPEEQKAEKVRQAQHEAIIASRKALHDAEVEVAQEVYETALSRSTDQTLTKVVESHGVAHNWFDIWGQVACSGCLRPYPCPTMIVICEDLNRREATDPAKLAGTPDCLLEGAL